MYLQTKGEGRCEFLVRSVSDHRCGGQNISHYVHMAYFVALNIIDLSSYVSPASTNMRSHPARKTGRQTMLS